jgi:CBS domain containing-hemolysin-like protein
MLNVIFGRIPDVHEKIEYAGYHIEILRKTRRNIELTRFTLIQQNEDSDSEENE